VPKPKNTKLSVFKGREAKLNKVIFQILALKGPLTIYDMHKEIKTQRGLRYTRYASVNKRARFLEESGYIRKMGIKKTKPGFEASTYELAAKAYLAILLNSVSLEGLLTRLDETAANHILADTIRIIGF
jgi:hypothetical protein